MKNSGSKPLRRGDEIEASLRQSFLRTAAKPVIEALEARSLFSVTFSVASFSNPNSGMIPPPPPQVGHLGQPYSFTQKAGGSGRADWVIGAGSANHNNDNNSPPPAGTVSITASITSNAGAGSATTTGNPQLYGGIGGGAVFAGKGASEISGNFTLSASPSTGIYPDSINYAAGAIGFNVGLCAPCDSNTQWPVRYFDGAAQMNFNDFIPTDSSIDLGRSWSNQSFSADGQLTQMGNGMSNDGTPYLQDFSSYYRQYTQNTDANGNPRNLHAYGAIDNSGTAYGIFQNYQGQLVSTKPKSMGDDKFSIIGNKIRRTLPDGAIVLYADFSSDWAPAQQGRMLSRKTPSGDGLAVNWTTNGSQISGMDYAFTIGSGTSASTHHETYTYTYITGGNQVSSVVQSLDGIAARTVNYDYYGNNDANGNAGDLKYVTKRNGDGSSPIVSTEYYRWYTSDSSVGYTGGLKMFVSNDGFKRAVKLYGLAGIASAADGNSTTAGMLDFADNYFEYETPSSGVHRVTKEIVQNSGQGCSCGKTGHGIDTLSYYTNPNPTDGRNGWQVRTTETLPDNNQNIIYTNAYGAVVLKVLHDVTANTNYAIWSRYNDNGDVTMKAEGIALTGYSETFGDLVGFGKSGTFIGSSGRVDVTNYYTTTDGVDLTLQGAPKSIGYQVGSTGAFIPVESWTYTDGGRGDGLWDIASETTYPDANNVNEQRVTTYSYNWYQSASVNTAQVKSVTKSLAAVSSAEHGSSSSNTTSVYYDSEGRVVWSVDGNGYITYTAYKPLTGGVELQIRDVDPSIISNPSVDGPSRNGSLPTALNITTSYVTDSQGRWTKRIDPNGNVCYKVYDDTTTDGTPHSVKTYTGWNATTHQPTGPIWATIYDPSTGIKDKVSYTWSATGGLPSSGGEPTGLEDFSSGNFHIESLTRELRNVSGQRVEIRQYVSFSGLSYVPDPTSTAWITLGTQGTHYLSTKTKYDSGGRLFQTTTPDGTITTTVFDARGLAKSQWQGTNDTSATEADPTGGSASGNNMVKVAEFTYDDDGNQLTSKSIADSSHSYTTNYKYDFRDRLINAQGPDGVSTAYDYDNLDEQTKTLSYVDADSGEDFDEGEQTGKSTVAYDDQGQAYSTTEYQGSRKLDTGALVSTGTTATVTLVGHGFAVGQQVVIAGASQSAYNGTFSITAVTTDTFTFTLGSSLTSTATGTRITVTADKRLTTGYWYDARGNLVKTQSPSGLIQKTFYDGAGRVVRDTTSADPTEAATPTYANAQTLSGDQVIEQNDYYLDAGGRTRIATNWKRDGAESSSTTGEATPDDFDHTSVVSFYDAADRLTATMDYGRDGAEAGGTRKVIDPYDDATYDGYRDDNRDDIPDAIQVTPGLSNGSSQTVYDWIYTGYAYNAAGELYSVTDNANRQTRYAYDFAGRKTAMIENYVNGTASETETDTDRTTNYVYDAYGRLEQQVALNPLGSGLGVQSQATTFLYLSPIDRSWVTHTIYGDSTAFSAGRELVDLSNPSQSNGQASIGYGSENVPPDHEIVKVSGVTNDARYNSYFIADSGPYTFSFSVPSDLAATATGTVAAQVVNESDLVKTTYDRLGRKATETDQRGVTHTYTYDSASGLLVSDSIGTGTLGSNVNGRVRTITYGYDDQQRLTLVSSKDASGSVLNQVGFVYDAWGNVIRDYQAHDGAVVSGTPVTQYVYADGSGTGTTAKYVRLAKTIYPSSSGSNAGTYLTDYGTSDADVALVRSIGVSDVSANPLVRYAYLGAGQIIQSIRPQADDGISDNLMLTAGSKADHYAGLDRYGRWRELVWEDEGDDMRSEDRVYRYDRMGNRLSLDNALVNGTFDEVYGYDGLNRLTSWQNGTLSSNAIASGTAGGTESWTLDALGNWRSHTHDWDTVGVGWPTLTDTRTVNGANEITTYTGTRGSNNLSPPTYDATGNITGTGYTANETGPVYHGAFDGWNRQVVTDYSNYAAPVEAGDQQTSYDGLGRLITSFVDTVNDSTNNAGTTEEFYYNESDQIIEVRKGIVTAGVKTISPNARERTVWDDSYVNAAAVVELDNNDDGTADQRLYPLWDANYNVTALAADHGRTVERYVYNPYGEIKTAFNGASNYAGTGADEGSEWSFDWTQFDYPGFHLGFQGMRWDEAAGGQYLSQTRRYLPSLGTWNSRDPLDTDAYDTEGMSLYQFTSGDPLQGLDPTGLWNDGERKYRQQFEDWVNNYRNAFGHEPDYGPGGEGAMMADYYNGLIQQQGGPGHSDLPGGEDFDYTRPDHFMVFGPYLPWYSGDHFQDLATSEAQARAAIANCDKTAFGDALHYGQDAFSHIGGGYSWNPLAGEFGHGYSLHSPDNPTGYGQDPVRHPSHSPDDSRLHPGRYNAASQWTQKMLDEWDSHCTRCGAKKDQNDEFSSGGGEF